VSNLSRSRAYLESALHEQQASAIAFLLRRPGQPDQELYLGSHARPAQGALERETTAESLFDLASVSKIFATVSLVFAAESEGKIAFRDPVRKYFSAFPGEGTTLLDLLTHRTGLPAHLEFFRHYDAFPEGTYRLGDQKPLLSWICEAGLPEPGQQVYSDLGFILLGLLLESLYGKTLPELFYERITSRLKLERTGYVTLPHAPAPARMYGLLAEQSQFVATETCPWRKKTLQGEVHDDNCWAFGGYAGHAGLFSTLKESAILFDHLLKQVKASPDFLQRAPANAGIFSYGFMTYPGLRPFPGPAFAGAFGHTGFTGTSAWLHEPTGTMAILLSNRVHPNRADGRWINTRLEFHKLLWEELGL
jgi:CubicO group peptidase (beta-lactamase class C family)